jgi:hypothetical protein
MLGAMSEQRKGADQAKRATLALASWPAPDCALGYSVRMTSASVIPDPCYGGEGAPGVLCR